MIKSEKIQQSIELLNKFDIDLWLMISRTDSEPTVNLLFGQSTIGLGFYLISKKGDVIGLFSSIDCDYMAQTNLFTVVESYDLSPQKALNRWLNQLKPPKIALNYSVLDVKADGLSYGLFLWLKQNLKQQWQDKFCSAEALAQNLRGIKTSGEITCIKNVAQKLKQSFEQVLPQIKINQSELEIAKILNQSLSLNGLRLGFKKEWQYPLVCLDRGGVNHRQPSNLTVQKGDILTIGLSGSDQGYVALFGRGLYCSDYQKVMPPAISKLFTTAFKVIQVGAQMAKAGILAWQVDQEMRKVIAFANLDQPQHALGHQFGLSTHEGGTIIGPLGEKYGNSVKKPLLINEVYTLQVSLKNNNNSQVMIQENVVVLPDRVEFLTSPQRRIYFIYQ